MAQDPKAPANCLWKHDLLVTEQGGIALTLKRFLAYGHDLSGSIAAWFGTALLPANGTLRTTMCWSGVNVPLSVEFEVGGDDAAGNKGLDWKKSVQFTGPPK